MRNEFAPFASVRLGPRVLRAAFAAADLHFIEAIRSLGAFCNVVDDRFRFRFRVASGAMASSPWAWAAGPSRSVKARFGRAVLMFVMPSVARSTAELTC